jgi:carboxymethylenebutenolidase
MCDDLTERDNQKWLAEKKLRRRELAVGVGATAAILAVGCDSEDDPVRADAGGDTPSDAGVATKSSKVTIETPDGEMDAFFVHPETGKHAAVIFWPDILGPRAAFETMSTRLAGEGYAVLVVNQYYRSAKAPVIGSWDEFRTDEGRAKLMPYIKLLTPEGTTSDAGAVIDWLDKQSAVDTGKKVGASGYCMGGPFTIRTAASRPERVGAIASFHGGGLATDAPDSPHLSFTEIEAEMLIAIAQNDDKEDPEVKNVLEISARAADLTAEIEVYPAQHGWCPTDSTVYDQEQAEKAWARMLVLFAKL